MKKGKTDFITTLTGEVKEFEVTVDQTGLFPDKLKVVEGDIVRIKIENKDLRSGLALPAFGIEEIFMEGEQGKVKIIEFVAHKYGKFNFVKNITWGTGHGDLNGELVVEYNDKNFSSGMKEDDLNGEVY